MRAETRHRRRDLHASRGAAALLCLGVALFSLIALPFLHLRLHQQETSAAVNRAQAQARARAMHQLSHRAASDPADHTHPAEIPEDDQPRAAQLRAPPLLPQHSHSGGSRGQPHGQGALEHLASALLQCVATPAMPAPHKSTPAPLSPPRDGVHPPAHHRPHGNRGSPTLA